MLFCRLGDRTVVLEEKTDVWINLHDMLYKLPLDFRHPSDDNYQTGDFYFLWGSERSGFMQVYLYKYSAATGSSKCMFDGANLGRTDGWVVEDIRSVDLQHGWVYLAGNYSNFTERHLLRVNFHSNTAEVKQITDCAGWHEVTVCTEKGYFADVVSSKSHPAAFYLCQFDPVSGSILKKYCIFDAMMDDVRVQSKMSVMGALIPPDIHVIRSGAPSPEVDLYCAVYMPPGFFLKDYLAHGNSGNLPKFPAIMSVYGGPHVMRVQNQWLLTADLRAQRMAQQGIVVIKCDNRGSYRRGLAFEGAIRHDMGNVEILDQVSAVEYFSSLGLVDASRVGMFGWSYGGYMSAMALCRAPNTFSCAVAGAPVTSWDGYDTHYTERYMGHPDVNVKGYEDSSVMTHAHRMTGHLMLVHGLIDENVHFRHTARLINKLIEHRKRYEMIMFPCERHSPHKMQDKIYMEDIIFEFFIKHLSPASMAEVFASLQSTGSVDGSSAQVGKSRASL